MLGISVGLFSVVYISVLTVPYSPPTPSANIIYQIDDGNIILSHYGGKALNLDTKIVMRVDGQPVDPILAGDYLYNDFNGDGLWSVGEKVVFSYESLVSGGEQIEVNILDIGSNSLVMTGEIQVGIDTILIVSTSVDTITPYESSSSPISITATGPLNLDNVTLYYRWSDDNSTWDGSYVDDENNNTVDSNGCDEDTSPDKGTETNFVNVQDTGPDSDYMDIQEENIGGTSGSLNTDTIFSAQATNTNSLTISNVNVPADVTDAILVVVTACEHDIDGVHPLPDDVDWGTDQLTKVEDHYIDDGGNSYSATTAMWILRRPDIDTTKNVIISWDTTAYQISASAFVIENVVDANAEATAENTGQDTSPTNTVITTVSSNAFIVDVFVSGSTTLLSTTQAGQTERIDYEGSSHLHGVSDKQGPSIPGDTTLGWNCDNGNRQVHVIAAFALVENYGIDFEYNWSTADHDKDNEEICIYVDSHTGSENLNINYYNGGSWTNLGTITNTGWNNFTATGLISSTYTIQLIGTTESSDSIQDNWDIDCVYLRTWNSTSGPYGWTEFGTDTSHPWIWSFDFPIGIGYYQFYSIGQKSGLSKEIAPAFSDAICKKI